MTLAPKNLPVYIAAQIMSTFPTPETIGARIAAARTAADLSLERVAVELAVSRDTVERYEKGATAAGPSFLSIVTIARLTGRPIEWFMGENGNGEKAGVA